MILAGHLDRLAPHPGSLLSNVLWIFVIFLLGMELGAQSEPLLPSYPSRQRYEEETYRKVLTAIDRGENQFLVDLINADPIVCRSALLRILESPARDREARKFAALFSRGSASRIEEPLVDFVGGRSESVRRETLNALSLLDRLYVAQRRTGFLDERARRLRPEIAQVAREITETLEAVGFGEGRAETLLFRGRYLMDFGSDELPEVLHEAVEIFRRHANVSGQFLALHRLASYHHFRGVRQDRPVDTKIARRLMEEYKELVEDSRSPFLSILLHERLPEDLTYQDDWTLTQWRKLTELPGLPLLKAKYLLWLAKEDPAYAEELDHLMAGIEDPLLLAKLNYFVFSKLPARSPRFDAAADRAIHLASELGYDISAFDGESPESISHPLVPAVVEFHFIQAESLRSALRFEASRDATSRALKYFEGTARSWSEDQRTFTYPLLLLRHSESLRELGEYPQAVQCAQRAFELAEEVRAPIVVRRVAMDLAAMFTRLSDFRRAEEILLRARKCPTEHFDPMTLYLAELNMDFSRFDEALRWISVAEEEAREERHANFWKSPHNGWATMRYRLLSLIWLQLGDLERSQRYAETLDGRHLTSRGVLGYVLIAQARYGEAEQYFQDRVARFEARKDQSELLVDSLKNLGRISRITSDFDRSERYLRRALELLRGLGESRTIGNEGVEEEILYELGRVAIEEGRFDRARSLFTESLEIAEAFLHYRGIWSCNFQLGRIAERESDISLAVSHYRRAVEAVEAVSTHLKVDAHSAVFRENKTLIFDQLVRLLGPTQPREAFYYAEKRRAQAYLESLRARGFGGVPPSGTLLRRRQEIQARLIGKQTALRDQLSRPPESREERLLAQLVQEVNEIRMAHSEVLRSIHLRNGTEAYRRGLVRALRVEEVQSRILTPDQILVEYLVADDAIFALVVSKTNCRFYRLFGNRDGLRRDVEAFVDPFRRLSEGSVDLLHVNFDVSAAHRIYQQIFEPLEPVLRDTREVIVVPDDVLHYVPFESLVRQEEMGRRDRRVYYAEYSSVDWLVRKHRFSYAISATSLDPDLAPKEEVPATLLAFAEPLSRIPASETEEPSFRGNALIASAWRSIAPLPRAVEEIRSVAKLTESWLNVITFTGSAATESVFHQEASNAGYLHFAVHSLVDDELPAYSSLILSRDESQDGFLQSYEILETKLNAALVVLSACETGLGRLYRGEGILGLKRAFLVAGARSVLVSLWSVEDSAADFIAEFYRRLVSAEQASDALRQAKLSYLDRTRPLGGDSSISLSHPMFWAPITLTVGSVRGEP